MRLHDNISLSTHDVICAATDSDSVLRSWVYSLCIRFSSPASLHVCHDMHTYSTPCDGPTVPCPFRLEQHLQSRAELLQSRAYSILSKGMASLQVIADAGMISASDVPKLLPPHIIPAMSASQLPQTSEYAAALPSSSRPSIYAAPGMNATQQMPATSSSSSFPGAPQAAAPVTTPTTGHRGMAMPLEQ
jgi:hypothetical protein